MERWVIFVLKKSKVYVRFWENIRVFFIPFAFCLSLILFLVLPKKLPTSSPNSYLLSWNMLLWLIWKPSEKATISSLSWIVWYSFRTLLSWSIVVWAVWHTKEYKGMKWSNLLCHIPCFFIQSILPLVT